MTHFGMYTNGGNEAITNMFADFEAEIDSARHDLATGLNFVQRKIGGEITDTAVREYLGLEMTRLLHKMIPNIGNAIGIEGNAFLQYVLSYREGAEDVYT